MILSDQFLPDGPNGLGPADIALLDRLRACARLIRIGLDLGGDAFLFAIGLFVTPEREIRVLSQLGVKSAWEIALVAGWVSAATPRTPGFQGISRVAERTAAAELPDGCPPRAVRPLVPDRRGGAALHRDPRRPRGGGVGVCP